MTMRSRCSPGCASRPRRHRSPWSCNFTPVPREDYRIGLPHGGRWREVLNTDAPDYGGSGKGNLGAVIASDVASHGLPASAEIVIPPLGCVYFVYDPI